MCRHRYPPLQRFRSGFSIVELLVVIGVVGALCVMVFPAFQRVVENGRNTRCISNLKSCAQAIFAHSADNRQRMVLPYASKADRDVENFPHLKEHPQTGGWYEYLIERGYIGNPDVVVCPSWFPHRFDRTKWGMTYGMRRTDSSSRYDDLIHAAVMNPAHHVVLADSHRPPVKGEQRQWYYITWRGNGFETMHFRHQRRANILFLDGSVRALTSAEVLGLNDGWNSNALTEAAE